MTGQAATALDANARRRCRRLHDDSASPVAFTCGEARPDGGRRGVSGTNCDGWTATDPSGSRADQEEPLACLGPLRHRGDRFGGRPKGRRHRLDPPSHRRLDPDPPGCLLPWDEQTLWHLQHTHRRGSRLPVAQVGTGPATDLSSETGACRGHLFITVVAYQLVQLIRPRMPGGISSWTGAASSRASTASPPPSPGPTDAHCICAKPRSRRPNSRLSMRSSAPIRSPEV